VRATLFKAGLDEETVRRIADDLPPNLVARHVEVEVVAERVFPEKGERS
jgi:hypothetical protein